MKNKIVFIAIVSALLSSCDSTKPLMFTTFDTPFIYIESEEGARETRMADNVSDEKTYYIYMSTKALDRKVQVRYEIIAGDGLTEGVDYEISPSSTNPVSFNPGRYVAHMRIIWKSHAVDPAKDNTLRIVLTENSENFTMGYPGPDKYNIEHKITRYSAE